MEINKFSILSVRFLNQLALSFTHCMKHWSYVAMYCNKIYWDTRYEMELSVII